MEEFEIGLTHDDQLFVAALTDYRSGQFSKAETAFRKILSRNPRHPGSLHYLGAIAGQYQKTDQAIILVKKALEIDRSDADAAKTLGLLYLSKKKLDLAIENFKTATELKPKFLDAWTCLGGAYLKSGQLGDSEKASLRALEIDPASIDARQNLATKYFFEKEYQQAIKCYEKIVEILPNDVSILLNYAAVLGLNGSSDKAITVYERILELDPKNTRAMQDLGVTFSEIGEVNKAISMHTRVLGIDKENIDAYFALSNSKPGLTDEQLINLKSLTGSSALSNNDQIRMNFALAKSYDDRSQYAIAYDYYLAGNELRKAAMAKLGIFYDRNKHEDLVGQIIEDDSANGGQLIADNNPKKRNLIFVVGMPRSGTTLVDQVLSAHSNVQSVGESEVLDRAIRNGCTDLSNVGKAYVDSLRYIKVKSVVNKLPFNFLHVGLILRIYPDARIIHCKRDWRDTLLSCYAHNFTDNHPWSTDAFDIRHYYKLYQKLMRHWEICYPASIYNMVYEDLVKDFEGHCRKIIQFANLPWEAGCLEFHKSQSVVQSASKWQVREPINSRSVGRWRHYKSQIESLAM